MPDSRVQPMKKTTKRKPIRRVTSAEEQHERAELAKYRASLRRIQETERLAKKLRRASITLRDTFNALASDSAATALRLAGNSERPAAVHGQ